MQRAAARARSATRSLVCGTVRRIAFLTPPAGPGLAEALRSPFAGAPEPTLPAGAPAAAAAEPIGGALGTLEPLAGLPTLPLAASWGTLIAAIGAGELLGHEGTSEGEAGSGSAGGEGAGSGSGGSGPGGDPPDGGGTSTTGGSTGGTTGGTIGGSTGGSTGGASGGSTGGASGGSSGGSTSGSTGGSSGASGGGPPGIATGGQVGGPGAGGPPSVFLPGVPLPGGSPPPVPEPFATVGASTVPEPATLSLTAGGLAALVLASRRRRSGGTQ